MEPPAGPGQMRHGRRRNRHFARPGSRTPRTRGTRWSVAHKLSSLWKLSDFTFKAGAACRLAVSADHRHAAGVDLHHQLIGHRAPDEVHYPKRKDTRKCEQQAPQFRHGLASDMGVINKKSRRRVLRKARHSIRAMAVGKRGTHLYFRGQNPGCLGEIMPYQLYESLQTITASLTMLQ